MGWVVGHSFIVYGPLLQGCTTLVYEGKPVGTPDASNFWRTIERHKVVSFFTAPTALRAIKRDDRHGDFAREFKMDHLKSVFLAGEHADRDTVHWTEHSVGVPVRDNWWQTETGVFNYVNEFEILSKTLVPLMFNSWLRDWNYFRKSLS